MKPRMLIGRCCCDPVTRTETAHADKRTFYFFWSEGSPDGEDEPATEAGRLAVDYSQDPWEWVLIPHAERGQWHKGFWNRDFELVQLLTERRAVDPDGDGLNFQYEQIYLAFWVELAGPDVVNDATSLTLRLHLMDESRMLDDTGYSWPSGDATVEFWMDSPEDGSVVTKTISKTVGSQDIDLTALLTEYQGSFTFPDDQFVVVMRPAWPDPDPGALGLAIHALEFFDQPGDWALVFGY